MQSILEREFTEDQDFLMKQIIFYLYAARHKLMDKQVISYFVPFYLSYAENMESPKSRICYNYENSEFRISHQRLGNRMCQYYYQNPVLNREILIKRDIYSYCH